MFELSAAIIFTILFFLIWKKDFHPLVLFISMSLGLLVITSAYFGFKHKQGADTMVLNGYITKKYSQHTSCSHSYSCNCRTVISGKTSSTVCDTCYEHSYDVDWVVKSTVGNEYINRVDRQGLKEPQRFTNAYIGEPFSIEKDYYNYIKASPLSVFKDYNAYKDTAIPSYPKVYDYYRIKHVIDYGSQWRGQFKVIDEYLQHKLKVSSSKAKANVLVIFFGKEDITEAMKVKNYGGRINDLTVMIQAQADGTITKVHVFSWSKADIVNVKLRDEILDFKNINGNQKNLVDSIDNILVNYYQHRSMEEFKYLEGNIQMPTAYYVLVTILMILILILNYVGKRHL